MWQEGTDGLTACTLDAPDGEPSQPDAHGMRMPRPAPAAVTGGLGLELKAQGHEAGEDTLEKGLAVTRQRRVQRFLLQIARCWCGLRGSVEP
jgi:hypothetical protein